MAKIFYIINSLARGGAERQMAELVRRLPHGRFEPILCLLENVNAYQSLLPSDQPRYVLRDGGTAGLRTLAGWLEAEKPDIIHSFMERSNLWGRLLARKAGFPIVITSVRGPLMAIGYRLVEGFLSRRSDAIVVNSRAIRDELVTWQRVNRSKVHVIPNIVDLDRFQPAPDEERRRVRAELGLRGTTFLIPGRVHMVKDPISPALAAALLRLRNVLDGDVTFLTAGRLDHKPALTAQRAVAALGGVGAQFRYLGMRDDIAALYSACDWVLLPSFSEGLSNAALEAHACARPMVISRGANPDGIVEHGVTGYEFRTGRFWSLAATLTATIDTPADRAAEMGRAGRERVRRLFDPERAFQRVLALYEELLDGKRERD